MFSDFQRIHLATTDSTQNEAKRHSLTLRPDKLIAYTADEQTNGRGTHQRSWFSPPLVNLYLTFSFCAPNDGVKLNHIPQVIALTIAETLMDFQLNAQLKWVNDVLVNRKKIAGILCEADSLGNHSNYHIGIGLNVNMPQEMISALTVPATSMMIELGNTVDKDQVFTILKTHFIKNVSTFFQEGFSPFHQTISDMIAFKGEEITFDQSGDGRIENILRGTLLGIDKEGRLCLNTDNQLQTFFRGRIMLD